MAAKVLIVDDDIVSRMVLMHLVDSTGPFDIQEAGDGQEAWEMLQAGLRPAIIFCDLRMPRMSGMELLRQVRGEAELNKMPFVLVSSATDKETVEQASDFGATGYIVKPFEADQLRTHLLPVLSAPEGVEPALAAEAPRQTLQRLGIKPDRLLAYLGGFENQLGSARNEVEEHLARGEGDAALQRIERLHTGCVTLGLTGAAAALKDCATVGLTAQTAHAAIDCTLRSVQRQTSLVRQI
jgi:two-component system, chemotaxis family, chemotaxis protein CheY